MPRRSQKRKKQTVHKKRSCNTRSVRKQRTKTVRKQTIKVKMGMPKRLLEDYDGKDQQDQKTTAMVYAPVRIQSQFVVPGFMKSTFLPQIVLEPEEANVFWMEVNRKKNIWLENAVQEMKQMALDIKDGRKTEEDRHVLQERQRTELYRLEHPGILQYGSNRSTYLDKELHGDPAKLTITNPKGGENAVLHFQSYNKGALVSEKKGNLDSNDAKNYIGRLSSPEMEIVWAQQPHLFSYLEGDASAALIKRTVYVDPSNMDAVADSKLLTQEIVDDYVNRFILDNDDPFLAYFNSDRFSYLPERFITDDLALRMARISPASLYHNRHIPQTSRFRTAKFWLQITGGKYTYQKENPTVRNPNSPHHILRYRPFEFLSREELRNLERVRVMQEKQG